jgi:hypothetical protein
MLYTILGPQGRYYKEADLVSQITQWILGECDDVMASEYSSFGISSQFFGILKEKLHIGLVGASRGGIIPLICTGERFCYRKLTPTPCGYAYLKEGIIITSM